MSAAHRPTPRHHENLQRSEPRRSGAPHRWAVALFLLALPLALAAAPPPQDAAVRARDLIAAQRFDEAAGILNAALAANPDDVEALRLRAEVYRRTDHFDAARNDLSALTRLRPDDSDGWFWLATIDRWTSRDRDALAEYGRVLALDHCAVGALTGRARVRTSLADPSGAESDLRAALACRPNDPEATELLADLLAKGGRRPEAEQLLAATFSGADLEREQGDLELSGGHPAAAERHFAKALAAKPDDPALLKRLGDARREEGRDSAALDAYRRAVALAPGDTGALYWEGLLANRAGRFDEARGAYQAILAHKPNDAGALVGLARVERSLGHNGAALELVDKALAIDPDNGEARVLRGSLLEGFGRTHEAREEYLAVLAKHPDDGDAQLLAGRLGPPASFTLTARSDRSRVIEGLENAGFLVNGISIVPANIEYITDGAELAAGSELSAGTNLAASVIQERQAVLNYGYGTTIYDFNVTTATAGLDHQLSDDWRLAWRVGGTRYDPRLAGTISTEDRFRGNLELDYYGADSRLTLAYSRSPFIERGFGGNTQFRIFDEDRFTVGWERTLGAGFSLRSAAGVSFYKDGDTPVNGSLALAWNAGDTGISLRLGEDPFPARFLGENLHLDYIDYTDATLAAHTSLGAGFRASASGVLGRFGAAQREDVVLNESGIPELTVGPYEHDTERSLTAELAWSPPSWNHFSLGADYFYDHFTFHTGPFNNLDTNTRTLFAEVTGGVYGRSRFTLRAAHSWIGDDRNPSYNANTFLGSFQVRLGKLDSEAGAYWLGFDGSYGDNTLREESLNLKPEQRLHLRAYLTVPL